MLLVSAGPAICAEDRIEITPSSWDVGLVVEGRTFEKNFLLRPADTASIVIDTVWAPCGDCLTAALVRSEGTKDAPAAFHLVLDTKGLVGVFKKAVLVSTRKPRAVYRFNVNGRTYKEFEPPFVVEVFYSREDAEGRRVEKFFENLREKRLPGSVTLKLLPIDHLENYRLLREREAALGIREYSNVECFVAGSLFLAGEAEIEREIPGILFPSDAAAAGQEEDQRIPPVVPSAGLLEPVKRDVPSTSLEGSDTAGILQVRLFLSSDCRGCGRVLRHMARLREEFGEQLDYRALDVNEDDNDLLAMATFPLYEMKNPAGVVLLVGDRCLSGKDAILDAAEAVIREQMEQGGRRLQVLRPGAVAEIEEHVSAMSVAAIVAAGLVDGVNPCAFATIVLFIAILAAFHRDNREVLAAGAAFCAGVFVAYYLIGLAFFRGLKALTVFRTVDTAVYWAVPVLAVFFGVVSLVDAIRYKKTGRASSMFLKVPSAIRDRFAGIMRRNLTARRVFIGAFCAGLVIAVLEGICTGQMYLPVIAHMARTPGLQAKGHLYLLMYNGCFMLPLVVIFLASFAGVHFRTLNSFLVKHLVLAKVLLACVFFMLAGVMLWLG